MAFFEIKEFTEDYKKGIDFYTVFSINYIRDLQFYNFFSYKERWRELA